MIDADPAAAGSQTLAAPLPSAYPFAALLAYSRVIGITLVIALAAAVRCFDLGASGFSEDEINKLRAVEAYERGDFSANAEHPMLMKLSDWASLRGARWWNAQPALAGIATISPEAAIRLPNALAGAAIAGILFLLAEALFGTTVGAWASLLWAVDVNAAAINRIGKEDTFLLLFLLLASLFYERAKARPAADPARARWFTWSGVSFGLMLASKYMPHYFGLHVLFNIAADRQPVDKTPDKRRSFYFAMGAAFVAANFAILLPSSWRYLAAYTSGNTLRHSGYAFAHHVYVNTIEASPWGLPPTFYFAFFATKVPLIVLAAALVGIVWVIRNSRHRGATFVRVFLVFTLLPYSLVASKFLRYMLPVLAVVDIAAAIGIARIAARLEAVRSQSARLVITLAVAAALLGSAVAQQLAVAPYYGLAQNWIGARLTPPGGLFPDDEFYDAGVREAVQAIAGVAGPGAVVCSDATAVVDEYLRRFRRPDMRACSIAADGLPMSRVETWVIAQEGHIYFENAAVIEILRRTLRPWLDVKYDGVSAAQIYRFQ